MDQDHKVDYKTIRIVGKAAIITIEETYDFLNGSDIMDFGKSAIINRLEHIIYDCKNWQGTNVLGGEIFELKEKLKKMSAESLIFCGANEPTKWLLNTFSEMLKDYPDYDKSTDMASFILMDSVEEALAYIEK